MSSSSNIFKKLDKKDYPNPEPNKRSMTELMTQRRGFDPYCDLDTPYKTKAGTVETYATAKGQIGRSSGGGQ